MTSNSSAKELHEHAELFRRWADETDSSEMREAFLSLAASVTDRLLWPICQKNNEGSEARRIAANIAKLPELRRRPQY